MVGRIRFSDEDGALQQCAELEFVSCTAPISTKQTMRAAFHSALLRSTNLVSVVLSCVGSCGKINYFLGGTEELVCCGGPPR